MIIRKRMFVALVLGAVSGRTAAMSDTLWNEYSGQRTDQYRADSLHSITYHDTTTLGTLDGFSSNLKADVDKRVTQLSQRIADTGPRIDKTNSRIDEFFQNGETLAPGAGEAVDNLPYVVDYYFSDRSVGASANAFQRAATEGTPAIAYAFAVGTLTESDCSKLTDVQQQKLVDFLVACCKLQSFREQLLADTLPKFSNKSELPAYEQQRASLAILSIALLAAGYTEQGFLKFAVGAAMTLPASTPLRRALFDSLGLMVWNNVLSGDELESLLQTIKEFRDSYSYPPGYLRATVNDHDIYVVRGSERDTSMPDQLALICAARKAILAIGAAITAVHGEASTDGLRLEERARKNATFQASAATMPEEETEDELEDLLFADEEDDEEEKAKEELTLLASTTAERVAALNKQMENFQATALARLALLEEKLGGTERATSDAMQAREEARLQRQQAAENRATENALMAQEDELAAAVRTAEQQRLEAEELAAAQKRALEQQAQREAEERAQALRDAEEKRTLALQRQREAEEAAHAEAEMKHAIEREQQQARDAAEQEARKMAATQAAQQAQQAAQAAQQERQARLEGLWNKQPAREAGQVDQRGVLRSVAAPETRLAAPAAPVGRAADLAETAIVVKNEANLAALRNMLEALQGASLKPDKSVKAGVFLRSALAATNLDKSILDRLTHALTQDDAAGSLASYLKTLGSPEYDNLIDALAQTDKVWFAEFYNRNVRN